MEESGAIQTAILWEVIQEATMAVMALTLRQQQSQCRRHTQTKHCGHALRQTSFNWEDSDKYAEILSFDIKVKNLLHTRKKQAKWWREIPYHKKVARKSWTALHTSIHKFWKGDIQNSRRTVCYARWGTQPQHNETILSLWSYKLNSKSGESIKQWMGKL